MSTAVPSPLLAALLLGGLLVGSCFGPAAPRPSTPHRAVSADQRGVASESTAPPALRPPGTSAWRLSRPALDRQIEGYATTSSGLPGARVALRVSTSEPSYRVRAYRIGAYRHGTGHLVWTSRLLPGARQPGPSFLDQEQRTVVAPWRTSVVAGTAGWDPGSTCSS